MTSEINPNAAVPAASPPRTGNRRRALLILAAIVLLAAIAAAAWYLLVARWYEGTDDAYADGNVVAITPQTAGTVVSIGVDDGMKVEAGQVLLQLDASDAEVAYEQAVANLASAVRQVRGLYSAVDAGQAELQAQRTAVERARADVERREGLVASGAVSAEELAHARNQLAAAEAALAASQGQLTRNRALVDETELARHPQVQAAAAQLREAWLNLQRTEIVAPVSGYVAERAVQLGQRVQPGAPVMTVVPLQELWVEANFKETQLARMRIGQPAEVHADLYGDDVTYHGTVASLGMGTGSAFSLLPAQNASGNWIKIVQRVPVRIALQDEELAAHPLRLGLSMDVNVDLHDTDGPVLAEQAPTEPVLTTAAYADQLAEAEALIRRIVHENMGAAADDARHG